MSGTLHLVKKNKKNTITNSSFYNSPFLPNKHNHVELVFKNLRVIYNDPRRFGFFKILDNKIKLKNFINNYGIEPLNINFNFYYVKKSFMIKEKI